MFSTCFFQNFVVCHFMWWLCLEYLEVETLQKKTPRTQIGMAFLLLLSALALLLHPFIFWFCICLSTYKHTYTRYNPNLLLLICSCNMSTSHLLAPQPGCSANVHCQAGTGSSWQMRPVSTLSADGLKFCVSILFCCAWWTHRVGHWVCVPFVSTLQTPHVCLGSPLSPRVRLQISPLVLRHLCLSPPSTCWNSCLGMPAIVA